MNGRNTCKSRGEGLSAVAQALPPLVLIGDPRLAQSCAPVDPAEISTPDL